MSGDMTGGHWRGPHCCGCDPCGGHVAAAVWFCDLHKHLADNAAPVSDERTAKK